MHKGLDVKPQSWTHARDIFIVEFFQYGSLSSVVKSATSSLICSTPMLYTEDDSQKQQSHFLLLSPVLSYNSEQPHYKVE